MKKVAVVYMAHDGFASLYSGVGTLSRDFLLSFPEVSQSLREMHPDVEVALYVATMKFNDTSFALSHDIRDATLQFVAANDNIHFVELHNGSSAQDAYGTLENWKNACISAATFLSTITDTFDEILTICVDTPFVQVANRFLDTYDAANVRFIWLPQSTVKIHRYGMSADADQQGATYVEQRYDWEKGVVALAKKDTRVRIGSVGKFMKQHLIKDYDAEPSTLVDITNSLYLERLKKNVRSQTEIRQFLKGLDVPLNRPLIFSFGRAEPYKGLDLVLKNVDRMIKDHDYFTLIFAAPYSMDDPYVAELSRLAAKHPNDIKVLYNMDFTAPHYVMQWHNTHILAILSRSEPFGIIPIESRFYNNPNLTLLASDIDGLKYQVQSGIDGFLTELTSESIQATFSILADMDKGKRRGIARNGYDRVTGQYNQVNVNLNLLSNYISGLESKE